MRILERQRRQRHSAWRGAFHRTQMRKGCFLSLLPSCLVPGALCQSFLVQLQCRQPSRNGLSESQRQAAQVAHPEAGEHRHEHRVHLHKCHAIVVTCARTSNERASLWSGKTFQQVRRGTCKRHQGGSSANTKLRWGSGFDASTKATDHSSQTALVSCLA